MTDLEDRLQKGIDRRQLLKLLAASGVVLTGPLSRFAYAADELRYDGFGGTTAAATDKYALDPFKAQTGINVVHGTFSSQRDMLTKVRAGQPGDYQILHMSGLDWYKRYVDLGYTSELYESLIRNLKWIMPPLVEAFRKITPKA